MKQILLGNTYMITVTNLEVLQLRYNNYTYYSYLVGFLFLIDIGEGCR